MIPSALIPFAFSHLPDLFSLINIRSIIKSIIDGSTTNEAIANGIKGIVPRLVPILENIGATMFPTLAPALHVVAGAIVSFDIDKTRWLQQAVNTLLPDDDDIAVDGVYGPITRAAVEKVQRNLGLTPDGFAGKISRLAINAALNAIFAGQDKTQSGLPQKTLDAVADAPNVTDKSVSVAVLLKPAVQAEIHLTTGSGLSTKKG